MAEQLACIIDKHINVARLGLDCLERSIDGIIARYVNLDQGNEARCSRKLFLKGRSSLGSFFPVNGYPDICDTHVRSGLGVLEQFRSQCQY